MTGPEFADGPEEEHGGGEGGTKKREDEDDEDEVVKTGDHLRCLGTGIHGNMTTPHSPYAQCAIPDPRPAFGGVGLQLPSLMADRWFLSPSQN